MTAHPEVVLDVHGPDPRQLIVPGTPPTPGPSTDDGHGTDPERTQPMDTTATESSGPPRRKQVRGAERQELMQRAAKLYKAKGGTVRSVATEIGMSYGGAHRLLKDAVRARLLDGMKSRGTR